LQTIPLVALQKHRLSLHAKHTLGLECILSRQGYHDWNPVSGEEYQLRDRMFRKACGSFVLMVAGELPSDPEVEQAFSLEAVYKWLQDLPWQIERTVVRYA
jgi:hypothetical protein